MGECRTKLRDMLALTPIVLAGAAASGCASLGAHQPVYELEHQSGPAVLVSDAPAPPPRGAIDFCLRTSACAAEPTSSDIAAAEDVTPNRAPDSPAEHFRRMLLARARGESPAARAQAELTEERWRQLTATNWYVNSAIAPTHDDAQFGVAERWSMPLADAEVTDARARGDCEDYALEKRARLLALGWTPETVSLAIARLPTGTLHLVLVAQTDRGDFVLDNRFSRPLPITALNYEWLMRQAGPDLADWGVARLVSF